MKLSRSSVNWLILDYVAICEKRREVLNFSDFIDVWVEANALAEEEARSVSARRLRTS